MNSEEFVEWRLRNSRQFEEDSDYINASINWMNEAVRLDYSYMFQWLGIPVIQFPVDLLLIQEAIFSSKVNKIVEVGIARGGTTVFLASLLEIIGNSEKSSVIGVDVQISEHTRLAINNSRFQKNINLVQGSSTDKGTYDAVARLINSEDRVLVILDSNHSMNHVYEEMRMYCELVTEGSYLIVMDTAIEYLNPSEKQSTRPWGKGNNPQTAIIKFLEEHRGVLEIDVEINQKSLPGASRGGYLKKKAKNRIIDGR